MFRMQTAAVSKEKNLIKSQRMLPANQLAAAATKAFCRFEYGVFYLTAALESHTSLASNGTKMCCGYLAGKLDDKEITKKKTLKASTKRMKRKQKRDNSCCRSRRLRLFFCCIFLLEVKLILDHS